jgi:hypothetical protein
LQAKQTYKILNFSLDSLTHACIPSYSEGFWLDANLGKAFANCYLEKAIIKTRAGKVDQVVRDPA